MTAPRTTIAGEAAAPYLAVDILPDTDVDTFTLDVSEVDGFDLLGWGEGVWVNIVCDVMGVSITRGATRLQGALTRTEAGSATVTLTDTERRFDPMINADAVHPGTRVRVRAWGYEDATLWVEVRRNLATSPRATAAPGTGLGWDSGRWFGTSGAGTHGRISGSAGPFGITTVLRKTWTTASTSSGDTGFNHSGSASMVCTPGESIALLGHLKPNVGGKVGRATMLWYDAAGTPLATSPRSQGALTPLTPGVWNPVSGVFTVPSGAGRCIPVTDIDATSTNWAVGNVLDGTALLVERAAAVGGYFDGATAATGNDPGDVRYLWTGTVNASPSVQELGQPDLVEWSAPLFTGRIGSDFQVIYQTSGPPLVVFTAVDAVGPLALFQSIGMPDPGTGQGDNLLQRVARVVTEVGLPADTVAADSDAAYVATLPPSPLAGGWADVSDAVDAELGRVWVNASDQLVVRGRGSELSGPLRGTLSDVHGETVAGAAVHACYRDPVVRFGTDSLVNRAIAARRVPPAADDSTPPPSAIVQVDDEYSQARWTNGAPVTHSDTGLELEFDGQLRPWAEHLLQSASQPELRVDSVTVTGQDSYEAWRELCRTDLGDRWAFLLRLDVGPAVERTLGVLGIAHEITPESWTTTWTTATAPTPGAGDPLGWFTLDVSELDGGDVLPPVLTAMTQ